MHYTRSTSIAVTTPRVHQILRLALRGIPRGEIAEQLGLSPQTVGRVMKSPLYKERMAQLQEEADKQAVASAAADPVADALKGAALEAAQLNILLLKSGDVRTAQASAWDILDRVGYVKKQRSEGEVVSKVVIDADAARALGEALRECGLAKKS